MIRFCVWLLLACVGVDLCADGGERVLPGGEQTLILKNRSPLTGRVNGINNGQLVFVVEQGGGTLEYQVDLDDIERLQFPGDELLSEIAWGPGAKSRDDLQSLLSALYAQRSPYLRLLSDRELAAFVEYARLLDEDGDPLMALQIAKSILPQVSDSALQDRVYELLLRWSYERERFDDCYAFAVGWAEARQGQNVPSDAYYFLAQLSFERRRFDTALWNALEPIVLSKSHERLDACYAYAIASCVELTEYEHESVLRQEMVDRGLDWPDIPELANYQQPQDLSIFD
ncbi:MAG: hypothetical protein AAFX93_17620 [Verrucomicrobiota bacterium]